MSNRVCRAIGDLRKEQMRIEYGYAAQQFSFDTSVLNVRVPSFNPSASVRAAADDDKRIRPTPATSCRDSG
jgi:hypothetical protein